MSLSVNGESEVPPGFRFHPTEEELLQYYLRKKVGSEKIDLDVIREVDLNKLEPWDIQERCKIGSTPQNDWYFFSHKDKKYPSGTRTNRATAAGFWKATGRDKVINSNFKRIGMRKTLVFYIGRAPHGKKSEWIMHEYRLDDNNIGHHETSTASNSGEESSAAAEDGWVVCRVFMKKNYFKTLQSISPTTSSIEQQRNTGNSCNQENGKHETNNIINSMMREQKNENTQLMIINQEDQSDGDANKIIDSVPRGWVALDKYVACHLNGQVEVSQKYGHHDYDDDDIFSFSLLNPSHELYNGGELQFWSVPPLSSTSDPIAHLLSC